MQVWNKAQCKQNERQKRHEWNRKTRAVQKHVFANVEICILLRENEQDKDSIFALTQQETRRNARRSIHGDSCKDKVVKQNTRMLRFDSVDGFLVSGSMKSESPKIIQFLTVKSLDVCKTFLIRTCGVNAHRTVLFRHLLPLELPFFCSTFWLGLKQRAKFFFCRGRVL